jgi:hypothetical protein
LCLGLSLSARATPRQTAQQAPRQAAPKGAIPNAQKLGPRAANVSSPQIVSSPQLDITSYATDSTTAAGMRFSLVLDVRPASKVHVYAPGVKGYKPFVVFIEPQPGLVIGKVSYPKADDFYFKPLNEHVPVFDRPFRVVQDVAIDATPRGRAALKGVSTLTIRGTVSYQACDDTLCFNPQTVPLAWAVTLRPQAPSHLN